MAEDLQAKIDQCKSNVENIGVFKSWHYKQNVEKMKKVNDKVRSKSLMQKKGEKLVEFDEWKGSKLKRASEFQVGAAEKFSKQYRKEKREAIEKEIESPYWQARGSEDHTMKRKMKSSLKNQSNMLKPIFDKNG